VAAPGEAIITTADPMWNRVEYRYFSSTSFAAAHVTGVASLI
jgi:hypothetical protein